MSSYNGSERRMSQDELLGYMKGKLEALQLEMNEFKNHFRHHAAKEEADRVAILAAIADLKKASSIRHGFILAAKFVGIGAVFILTASIGDIIMAVKRLFS